VGRQLIYNESMTKRWGVKEGKWRERARKRERSDGPHVLLLAKQKVKVAVVIIVDGDNNCDPGRPCTAIITTHHLSSFPSFSFPLHLPTPSCSGMWARIGKEREGGGGGGGREGEGIHARPIHTPVSVLGQGNKKEEWEEEEGFIGKRR
jgi:hypothetical protein